MPTRSVSGTHSPADWHGLTSSRGRNIGRLDELLEIAADAGVTTGPTETALTNRTHRDVVQRDTARARSLGAQGVPFYVITYRRTLGGAHTAEALLNVFHGNR